MKEPWYNWIIESYKQQVLLLRLLSQISNPPLNQLNVRSCVQFLIVHTCTAAFR
jgi:hypothetical protein